MPRLRSASVIVGELSEMICKRQKPNEMQGEDSTGWELKMARGTK